MKHWGFIAQQGHFAGFTKTLADLLSKWKLFYYTEVMDSKIAHAADMSLVLILDLLSLLLMTAPAGVGAGRSDNNKKKTNRKRRRR